MRRLGSRVLTTFAMLGFLVTIGAVSGCDSGNTTSDAPLDAEAKKLDSGVQGGMKEFMQSKQQHKAK